MEISHGAHLLKVLQSLVKMSKEGAADVLLPNGKLKQQQNKEEDTSQAEAVAEKDKRGMG